MRANGAGKNNRMWNVGVMESWNDGYQKRDLRTNIPIFHYSMGVS
jgi:hypothetical protein